MIYRKSPKISPGLIFGQITFFQKLEFFIMQYHANKQHQHLIPNLKCLARQKE